MVNFCWTKRGPHKLAELYSHLYPLDLDPPGVCGLVERLLHDVADGLALREDLGQVLRPQHVPQRRRRQ